MDRRRLAATKRRSKSVGGTAAPCAATDLVSLLKETQMITCHLRYVIDPYKLAEFENYGRMWIPLVEKFGGTHHGYFLPHEGPSNIAYALFSFPNLAEYEQYRSKAKADPDCIKAFKYAEDTRCIISFERYFMRPVFQ
jgi:hypothetical protein